MTLLVWAHQCVYFENITNSQILKWHHLSPSICCTWALPPIFTLSTLKWSMGPLGSRASLWKHKKCVVGWMVVRVLYGQIAKSFNSKELLAYGAIWSYHVDTAGSLTEDHEVCHSQWSRDSHKVFKHILLPNLVPKKCTNRSNVVSVRRHDTDQSTRWDAISLSASLKTTWPH